MSKHQHERFVLFGIIPFSVDYGSDVFQINEGMMSPPPINWF